MSGRVVPGRIQMDYAWNKGKAGTAFLQALSEERLVGSKCPKCAILCVPPESFCGDCLARTEFPLPAPDTGVIESFTEHAPSGRVFLLVRIDGVATLFLHHYVGRGHSAIGMRVRAVWNTERTGVITDLLGFEEIVDED